MGNKAKTKFGVWMDSRSATIVRKAEGGGGDFELLGHIENEGNAGEKLPANQATTLTQKYFKEIADKMDKIEEVHVTGPGQIQEHFMKFLVEIPKHKNAKTSESTSTKMSDGQLTDYMRDYFS